MKGINGFCEKCGSRLVACPNWRDVRFCRKTGLRGVSVSAECPNKRHWFDGHSEGSMAAGAPIKSFLVHRDGLGDKLYIDASEFPESAPEQCSAGVPKLTVCKLACSAFLGPLVCRVDGWRTYPVCWLARFATPVMRINP